MHSSPPWWPEGEHWPPKGGRSHEAWNDFGRSMFLGFVAFVGFMLVFAFGVGALLGAVLGGVSWSWGGVAGIVAAAAVAGLLLLARLIRRTWGPVRDMIRTTGRLADGDYSARVDVRSSPSMRAVAGSINTLAVRLEQADDQRRRLMSDLGHELRTPLAVIRGEVEAMVDGVREPSPEQLASLLDEVGVLERLIEDLRVLTLSEAGQLPLEMERFDLGALVDQVADAYRPVAAAANVTVDSSVVPVVVDADPVRVRQALTNLIVNALRAMPDGGSLQLDMDHRGDRAVVAITDSGTGISTEQLPRVFDRFVKGEESPGSGLGLSIARTLIRLQGGELRIAETGSTGTVAEFWLPA